MVVGELHVPDLGEPIRPVLIELCTTSSSVSYPPRHSVLLYDLPSSIVGESGLGKSTLINTLFATELVTPKNYRHRFAKQLDKTTEVEIIKAELQERDFSVKLTVIDTPGFGDYVNNRERSVWLRAWDAVFPPAVMGSWSYRY